MQITDKMLRSAIDCFNWTGDLEASVHAALEEHPLAKSNAAAYAVVRNTEEKFKESMEAGATSPYYIQRLEERSESFEDGAMWMWEQIFGDETEV